MKKIALLLLVFFLSLRLNAQIEICDDTLYNTKENFKDICLQLYSSSKLKDVFFGSHHDSVNSLYIQTVYPMVDDREYKEKINSSNFTVHLLYKKHILMDRVMYWYEFNKFICDGKSVELEMRSYNSMDAISKKQNYIIQARLELFEDNWILKWVKVQERKSS